MKPQPLQFVRTSLLLGVLLTVAAPVLAEFQTDERVVQVAWPMLSVEPPTDGGNYEVLKIGKTSGSDDVIYVITYKRNTVTSVLGTFNCDHTFDVMQNSTNGLYDIICVQENPTGDYLVFYLRADPIGNYHAHLAK